MNIAVSNQMGGAGKTTTTINVGGALANKGNDVLLIDADDDGVLTEAVGQIDAYDADETNLNDILMGNAPAEAARELVRTHEEFDVIPAHTDMTNIDKRLTDLADPSGGGPSPYHDIISVLEGEYDYILIDCPPRLMASTNHILAAAGNVLIPTSEKRRAVRSLERLVEQIGFLEGHHGISIEKLGIVINDIRYPLDGQQEDMLDWFRTTFEHVDLYEVRNRVAIDRALWESHTSIFAHREQSDMEGVYSSIASKVEQREANTRTEVSA